MTLRACLQKEHGRGASCTRHGYARPRDQACQARCLSVLPQHPLPPTAPWYICAPAIQYPAVFSPRSGGAEGPGLQRRRRTTGTSADLPVCSWQDAVGEADTKTYLQPRCTQEGRKSHHGPSSLSHASAGTQHWTNNAPIIRLYEPPETHHFNLNESLATALPENARNPPTRLSSLDDHQPANPVQNAASSELDTGLQRAASARK